MICSRSGMIRIGENSLIPAGIPELAKESTSREVKSGGEK